MQRAMNDSYREVSFNDRMSHLGYQGTSQPLFLSSKKCLKLYGQRT